MYKYRLIEFNSEKKEIQLSSNASNLQQVLAEFYKSTFDTIFDENGEPKGYIAIFINSKQIFSIKNISINLNDEICIVTSISGG